MGKLDQESEFESMMDKIFDVLFLIDIILTFKAAILTDDYLLIDDKKIIASIYLKGWFTVDVLSCIPYGNIGKIFLTTKEST